MTEVERGEFGQVKPICIGCNKRPDDLAEYQDMGRDMGMSGNSFVLLFEGTLNKTNGHFLCTPCYVRAGSPHSRAGWIAP